ncbi:MAG: hypothetical protein EA360_08870 [Balneolaceae bacterium]|nr:MAG: hypothetical protein EA360_08870 [Balneolaceae bacterium]
MKNTYFVILINFALKGSLRVRLKELVILETALLQGLHTENRGTFCLRMPDRFKTVISIERRQTYDDYQSADRS